MNNSKILGKTEFIIEKYVRKDCIVRTPGKCYIGVFKYRQDREEDEHWCFSLPVKTMYLSTIKDVKSMIVKNIEEDNAHGWEAEYKIAEIVNEPQYQDKGYVVTIPHVDGNTGVITVKINALGTIYVPTLGKYGGATLYNSDPLIEGINLIVKHGSEAIKAIKLANL